jgi:hypothetical protein
MQILHTSAQNPCTILRFPHLPSINTSYRFWVQAPSHNTINNKSPDKLMVSYLNPQTHQWSTPRLKATSSIILLFINTDPSSMDFNLPFTTCLNLDPDKPDMPSCNVVKQFCEYPAHQFTKQQKSKLQNYLTYHNYHVPISWLPTPADPHEPEEQAYSQTKTQLHPNLLQLQTTNQQNSPDNPAQPKPAVPNKFDTVPMPERRKPGRPRKDGKPNKAKQPLQNRVFAEYCFNFYKHTCYTPQEVADFEMSVMRAAGAANPKASEAMLQQYRELDNLYQHILLSPEQLAFADLRIGPENMARLASIVEKCKLE